MAEKQTSMTPARQERGLAPRGLGLGGGPFSMLQRMADEFDRMFEDFGLSRAWPTSLGTGPQRRGGTLWAPAIDVVQKDDQLVIKADVPGMKKEDLSIEIADNAITIQGERKSDFEEERGGVYRSERSYGSFYRVIPLPEGAITEQAKASFHDGVLEITLPVPPEATRRRTLEITEATADEASKKSEAGKK